MSKFINKTARFLFIPLLFVIMYSLTRTFVAAFLNYQWYSYIVAILFVAAIVFLMIISAKKAEKIYEYLSKLIGSIATKNLFFILCAVCLVLKIGGVFIFNCNCNLHPDMSKYISFADQIAHSGTVTENADYAIAHPYTLVFGLFLSPIGLISGSNPMGYAIFMCIINTITMLLLFDIIRSYAGNTTSFVGLLIYNLLPMGFFQTQVVIHETALLFLHILAFWLLQKVFEIKHRLLTRIICLITSFVCAVFGTAINQTGMVIIISFAIYSFIKAMEYNKSKISHTAKLFVKNALLLLLILVTAASAFIGSNFVKSACNKAFVSTDTYSDTTKSIPYGWPLYLGANYEESGAWNKEDRDTYYLHKEMENREEAEEYQRNLIKERFSEYLENPWRIPVHIYKKITILWSPYYAFRNVPNSPAYESMGTMAGGIVRLLCISAAQEGFSCFYLMTLIGLIKNKKRGNSFATAELHFMMVVLGLTLVLIPFEVMAKYSSHGQILIFAIGMMNFRSYRSNIRSLRNKIFH